MEIIKLERKKQKVLCKQERRENSIICGTENPSSLGCVFYELEGGGLGTSFVAGHYHEGHGSMLHGGFSAALLDEVMGRSINNAGIPTNKPFVTAEMTTRYRAPIMVGQKMYAFGRVERVEGRKCYNSGEIVDEKGTVMAQATGIYVMVDAAGDDNADTYDGIPRLPLDENDPKEL